MAGVDPGFPIRGGANHPEGAPTYHFAKFSKKQHEIEKILGRRWCSAAPALDPPLFGRKLHKHERNLGEGNASLVALDTS